MNTGRLAAEGVQEFMFVLGQAKLKGAVQMIINPLCGRQSSARFRFQRRGYPNSGIADGATA